MQIRPGGGLRRWVEKLQIRPGGGLYVEKSMVQNNGTIAFSNCSSRLFNGMETQAEDETWSDGIW